MSIPKSIVSFLILGLLAPFLGAVQPPAGRYALFLADKPASTRSFATQSERQSHIQRLEAAQNSLKSELARRNIPVTGSVQILLNAVFVVASESRVAELRALPGVTSVVPLKRFYPNLNAAVQLVNAPSAWNALGGTANAGAGVKIAIMDTGIDQNHAAFRNSTQPLPAGFPPSGTDASFTNNKVIVARSYVKQLGAGTPPNPAADSRPDDFSPRDRVGHGTAVAMVAAGQTNTGPSATITGMAPQAYLGNYKIFGSPGVIDFSGGDVIILALEDAMKDGMNVAVMSLGAPAFSGPLEVGSICGNTGSDPCDPEAQASENAALQGMVVVSAAGNEGDTGATVQPTLNTIDSPADAPSVIAAGASTNSHVWVTFVRVAGAPSSLQQISAQFGDGPLPAGVLTAPISDITKTGNDGLACAPLPLASLTKTIALVQRGTCAFALKVQNVQAAGAVGAILYDSQNEAIFPPGGLTNTTIPAVLISNADGLALKSYVDSNPSATATIDPAPAEQPASSFNTLAFFSSRGPSISTGAIKPDLVAVGTDLYMATQSYDPNGELYSQNGYTVANGTSFSTPMTAGAAALVKQRNPAFTSAQVRSALVNTATQDITGPFGIENVVGVGGGKLNAAGAIGTNVTITPPTLSFGILNNSSLPVTQSLTVTNAGTSSVSLNLSVAPHTSSASAQVQLSQTTLSLGAGQSSTVTATLSGSIPSPGDYDGYVAITGGAVTLHVPYLFIEGDLQPANLIPLAGDAFSGTVGLAIPAGIIAIKLIDAYGVPVPNVPVQFSVTHGTGKLQNIFSPTDSNGLAAAEAILGPELTQGFTVTAAGLSYEFTGTARPVPVIAPKGIVDAAGFESGKALAPGSFATIFGTGLSDSTDQAKRATLPLNIDFVNVSFDVPAAGISVPGHLYYVSPTQVNVEIPWELQGQTSVMVKVRIEDSIGSLYTLPLATYSPDLFAYSDANGQLDASALDQNQKLIGLSNAVSRGSTVQLFANGLGPVSNQPATGDPAPMQPPFATTMAIPTVMIGGQAAIVSFSGLAPGFSGLYQINAVVPSGIATGLEPVIISIGGVTSNSNVQLNVK